MQRIVFIVLHGKIEVFTDVIMYPGACLEFFDYKRAKLHLRRQTQTICPLTVINFATGLYYRIDNKQDRPGNE